jgi:sulfhydrogenase subunit beta (sulfur reductase)
MSAFFVTSSEFERLLCSWAQDRPVYVPVSRGGHRHWWRFSPETGPEPELDGIRAVEPLKTFYFHVKETVAKYPSGPESADEEPGFVLVGAKNCDLRSLECLDQTFATGDIQDPFWVSRREKAFVIGADCSDTAPTCFCTLLGMMPYPQSSFDLSVAVISGGLVVEVGSEKGTRLLDVDGAELNEASVEQLAERERNRERTRATVEEQNREFETAHSYTELVEEGFESPAWTKYIGRCREDAACLSVCPTCHCFVLYDQKAGDQNERVRVWDFCYLRGYTRVGGGRSARATGNDRFKNKYVKKFQFYPSRFDMMACTGCGRCIEACLAGIDMRQVFQDLEEGRSD